MRSKRGAELPGGGAAASVIGIITTLIIFYILFLPPGERRELLLDENKTGTAGGTADGQVLLLANIGKLDYRAETEFDHTVPNVYLAETKNAQAIERFNPFVVRNGWFVDEPKTLTFTVAQPEITGNVRLIMDATVREGILTVKLNDRVVYEGRPEAVNVAPIELKPEQLQPENTLEFEVSGVGLAFWRVNEYDLSNVQVIADITDIAKQESANIITLEPTEQRNLQRATLTFFPICVQREVGPLEVLLNNRRISSSVPDCESVNRIELDPEDLVVGRNSVVFRITQGAYRVEQIKLKTYLKEAPTFIDYFELNRTAYEDVKAGRDKLLLKITFVDDREEKRAELNINGRRDFIDQETATYERDLKTFAVEGNNYIELVPKSTLNVVTLEVKLE
ncbi:hypothetical protein HY493_02330 [Candidatus Woesearchaeota archaeon]|nr:hypothetical protein [Candidatus Woesearchaeota archaeon]